MDLLDDQYQRFFTGMESLIKGLRQPGGITMPPLNQTSSNRALQGVSEVQRLDGSKAPTFEAAGQFQFRETMGTASNTFKMQKQQQSNVLNTKNATATRDTKTTSSSLGFGRSTTAFKAKPMIKRVEIWPRAASTPMVKRVEITKEKDLIDMQIDMSSPNRDRDRAD